MDYICGKSSYWIQLINRDPVHHLTDSLGTPEVHDGHPGQTVPPLYSSLNPPDSSLHLAVHCRCLSPPSPLYTSSKDLMSDMCQVSVFRPWLVGENSAKTHSKSGERYKYIQSSDVIDIINISKIENIKENSFQGFKVLQTCPLVLKFLKT